jgi:hypothetical protein
MEMTSILIRQEAKFLYFNSERGGGDALMVKSKGMKCNLQKY